MENQLKNIRTLRNITQIELAEQVGVTQKHISQIEHGITNMSFPLACEIADYLNVSLDELAGRTPPKTKRGKARKRTTNH